MTHFSLLSVKTGFLWLLLVLAAGHSSAQQYQFNGNMSRQTMDDYLDKSIMMQNIGRPDASSSERADAVAMLGYVGAKFVGRIVTWYGELGYENGMMTPLNPSNPIYFSTLQSTINAIHANDPDVICQAAILEYLNNNIEQSIIPDTVFRDVDAAFGRSSTNTTRYVIAANMRYNPTFGYIVSGHPINDYEKTTTPDITKPETQYWFYYLAKLYIDAGCEAIHFGQLEMMNRNDIGNKCWYTLLTAVRQYAASHARRHTILLDGHTRGLYYEPSLAINLSDWQWRTTPNDVSKQLLLDFHSSPIRFDEVENDPNQNCSGPFRVTLNSHSDLMIENSFGGISPAGYVNWSTPYLLEHDNWNSDTIVGCAFDNNARGWMLWGWDEITWFAMQPPAYRAENLKYAYHRIKCLDTNGHLEMPGRRIIDSPKHPYTYNYGVGNFYRCYSGDGIAEKQVIKDVWLGNYAADNQCTSYVLRNRESGQVLDIGTPGTAGAYASQWPFTGATSQAWYVTPTGHGRHKLLNRNSGYILEIGGSEYSQQQEGSPANQWGYWGGAQQSWLKEPVPGAANCFTLKNAKSGYVLEIGGGTPQNLQVGAGASQWHYYGANTGSQEQEWEFIPYQQPTAFSSQGLYNITNAHSNFLLEILNADTQNGAKAIQYHQWPSNTPNTASITNQKWSILPTTRGLYKLVNYNSNKVLELQNGSSANADQMQQWDWDPAAYSQQWVVNNIGGGYYTFVNAQSGKILEIGGWRVDDFAPVTQWEYNSAVVGNNQKWLLTAVAPRGTNVAGDDSRQPSKTLTSTINSSAAGAQMLLYPNPASTVLYFALSGDAKVASVQVSDLRGASISTTHYQGGNQLDISSLATGVYLVAVNDGLHTYHQKFVKE
jgi:hypothetical protein